VIRKSSVNSPRDTFTGISPSEPISRISEPDLFSGGVNSSMRSAMRVACQSVSFQAKRPPRSRMPNSSSAGVSISASREVAPGIRSATGIGCGFSAKRRSSLASAARSGPSPRNRNSGWKSLGMYSNRSIFASVAPAVTRSP
jgi:hypothetical protein